MKTPQDSAGRYSRMANRVKPLVLLCACIVFGQCVYNNEEDLYPGQTETCDTTNITFSGKVAPVLRANCLACHGNSVAASNGGGIRLEDYSDVSANIQRLFGAMSHQPGYIPMPKGISSKIDECQINAVRIWKEAGTPDN
ncbi:MAG TPA: hypothetical protein VK152_03180 [Paludibacter sp.]|nr:hypothetical protein [Paludibacter sp.]